MSKKQTTSVKSKQSWLKYGLLIFVGLMVVGVVAFWGYQNNLNKADVDRFAALQSDFKKLQVEFNRIDPGWKYSELCRDQSGEFGSSVPSSCEVALYHANISSNNYPRYMEMAQKNVGYDSSGASLDQSSSHILLRKGFPDDGKSYCNIDFSQKFDQEAFVRCQSIDARSFYFPRIDQ